MKSFKKNLNGILLCVFEIAVGILLLIDPIGFTVGILTAAGILLAIVGLLNVIKYFRTEAHEAATGQYMMKGLVALVGGLFCILKSEWFTVTFPMFTILYGVAMLIGGLGKIQLTVDMARAKNNKWFLAIIAALISLACAAVILGNPFTTTVALWMFTGITLIVEAVFDAITLIVGSRKAKQQEEE